MDVAADATASELTPQTPLGLASHLDFLAGGQEKYSLLRFDLSPYASDIAAGRLIHAKLSLRNINKLNGGILVSQVHDTSWNEANVTYWSAPVLGSTVAAVPFTTEDGTVSADVTHLARTDADGILGLGLSSPIAQEGRVVSREGGEPARLVLSFSSKLFHDGFEPGNTLSWSGRSP